nr:MAG TPA: outer membrane protein [Caudoviricetes sp.]
MFYPVEYDPKLRIFNNQVDFYEFLAETNPEINVGLSALLPPTEFVVGEKHFPCRTIVDFFEQIAEQTGLPIDTKASTIRMGVILLFLTENLDESILTLQSGDANITLTPSVFKEVDAVFKVSVAEGYLWDPAGMPENVTINDEQCNIVYAEGTQTFTIKWSKKRSQVVNLGLTSTVAPEPEPPQPEPEPNPEPEPPVGGDGETTASVASQNAEPAISMEEAAPDNVDAILQQAAALEDEADKSGSKVALEAFAKQHGVSLARNKTFANMMKDFEAALRA